MFWGIDRPEWFLLWSGILGAVVSAAVAAWVASRVLVRSNRHQSELADEAATRQEKLAGKQMDMQMQSSRRALSEQRAQLQQQLAQQQSIAERQIEEQRKQASLAREQLAIAEVIIATEDFMAIGIDSEEVAANQLRSLRVAAARWRAELGTDVMQNELLLWTRVFDRAANRLRTEVLAGRDERRRPAASALSDAMAAISGTALSWQSADPIVREFLYKHLLDTRAEIEARLDSLDSFDEHAR